MVQKQDGCNFFGFPMVWTIRKPKFQQLLNINIIFLYIQNGLGQLKVWFSNGFSYGLHHQKIKGDGRHFVNYLVFKHHWKRTIQIPNMFDIPAPTVLNGRNLSDVQMVIAMVPTIGNPNHSKTEFQNLWILNVRYSRPRCAGIFLVINQFMWSFILCQDIFFWV